MRIPRFLQDRISVASQHPRRISSRLANKLFHSLYPHFSLSDRLSLQQLLMGGESGDSWARMYDKAEYPYPPPPGTVGIGSLDFNDASPLGMDIFGWLERRSTATVIQVGASSGREIAAIAKAFPGCRAIYTDIDETIVAGAQTRYGHVTNLEFQTCMAHEIDQVLNGVDTNSDIIIVSSGSLQYVHPEHIGQFFDLIKKCAGDIHIALIEPGHSKTGVLDRASSYRGGFSFTHDYSLYASSSSLKIETWRVIRPYLPQSSFGQRSNTIHLYGWFSKDE